MQAAARYEPRLQVGHLLIWVVGCAVGFAAYRSITPPRIPTPRGVMIVTGYSLAMGTAFGTILTGCGLLAYRRWKGEISYPSLAGHWLLIFGLAAAAADITAYLAHYEIGGRGTWPALYCRAAGWIVGAMIALGFLLARRERLPRHWLAVFLAFSLVSATLAVGHLTAVAFALARRPADTTRLSRFLVHVYAGSILVGALAILAAIARDGRSGAPGDGLHRLGHGAWLAIAAIQMVMYGLYLTL